MIEDARLPILTERMPARLDHLEPFVKDTVKATPRIETKLVLDVARNFVPQTAITRHPAQDAMLDAINPQLNELWKNAIAPGPMLKGLKLPAGDPDPAAVSRAPTAPGAQTPRGCHRRRGRLAPAIPPADRPGGRPDRVHRPRGALHPTQAAAALPLPTIPSSSSLSARSLVTGSTFCSHISAKSRDRPRRPPGTWPAGRCGPGAPIVASFGAGPTPGGSRPGPPRCTSPTARCPRPDLAPSRPSGQPAATSAAVRASTPRPPAA